MLILMIIFLANDRFANSPELFSKTCATLFERMLNTVPRGVELSEVIKPLPVKPKRVLLKYMGDGGLLLSGETRVCALQ